MNNTTIFSTQNPIAVCCALVILNLLSFTYASGQVTVPPLTDHTFISDITYNPVERQEPNSFTYSIEDGVTVRFLNASSASDGGIFKPKIRTSIVIAPSGPLQTGRVIFQNNETTGVGGIFYVDNGVNISVKNADFIGNVSRAASAANGGGVLRSASSGGEIKFENVLFQGNSANVGGVFYIQSTDLSVTSGTFINNYVRNSNGLGGVVGFTADTMKNAVFTNVSFINNRARDGGVANMPSNGGANLVITDAPEISDNWARVGGVINTANPSSKNYLVNIRLTGSTGLTDYVYSGNMATLTTIQPAQFADDSYSPASLAVARAGGFYYSQAATELWFDIADGVTLSIGKAGNNLNFDSIATSDAGTGAVILKKSEGTLVLHANNSHYQGTIEVQGGSLLLGTGDAKLGGIIVVASGATFGGSGTLNTLKANSTLFAGRTSVTAMTGATIRSGLDTSLTAETLVVKGGVTLKDGAILGHDLFSGGTASVLSADTITQEQNAQVNLGLLETGTFTLAEWTNGSMDASKLTLTVNGGAETARSSGTLFVEGKQLKLANAVSSLEMKWTGHDNAIWSGRGGAQNWTDGQANVEEFFRDGDRVVFDSVADSGKTENRSISIASASVVISDMYVSGSGDYTFKGAGSITADSSSIDGTTITGSGVLSKSGAGTLAFENTGTNIFTNGINLSGGVIAFNNTAQLKTGGAGISFADSATLRAAASMSGTLAESIAIGAGKTAGIDVGAESTLTHNGLLSSGAATSALQKTGDGTLQFSADNSAYAGIVKADKGYLLLSNENAKLGGNISVASGATFGGVGAAGIGGDVTVVSGAKIMAGVDSSNSGTLMLNNVKASGGAIFQFDLYKDMDGTVRKSDRIIDAGTSQISGTNIIDITTLASGTFNLGNLTSLAANYQVTLNDMVLPLAGRLSATVNADHGYLQLVTTTDKSRNVRWTGASGATWNTVATNWTASDGVNQYSYGDHAFFDGTSDATNPGNRNINLEGTQISLSDMTVDADVDYTFSGNGSIVIKKSFVMEDDTVADITDAKGKLTKSGIGTLTLANNNYNSFEAGIDINGGVIAFSRADQLGTTGTAITFNGNATLRANADDMTLANTIIINGANAAVLDTNGNGLKFTGALSGENNTAFAKAGSGTMIFGADISAFTGTLGAIEGTFQLNAANQLADAALQAIYVNVGATLDFGGHSQALTNLQGGGTVALGDSTLTYTVVNGGTNTFAGVITGTGKVIKKGSGHWSLAGSSTYEGGLNYDEGSLGLAASNALGTGIVTVNASNAAMRIEADGITIPNAISINTSSLTVSSDAGLAAFSGRISNGDLVLKGSGTLILSGNNDYSRLTIDNARTVALRAESIKNTVSLGDNSVLEFQNVPAGQIDGSIVGGGSLLFTSSTLAMVGVNNLRNVTIGANSNITIAAPNAIGGNMANVMVSDGARMHITSPTPVAANNITVDGGVIVFGEYTRMSSLALAGQLNFINGGEVGLNALIPTGIYTAAIADGGIPNMPEYNPHQGGMFMVLDVLNGDTLQITAYNMALEPGKDIAVGFDSLTNSMRSVYSHISEEFLTPLLDRTKVSTSKSLWFRFIGSYAVYGDDVDHLGYTDNTYVGMLGYDWISNSKYMVGGYFGFGNTRLETNNDANTKVHIPQGGLYGAARWGDFYLSADMTFGYGSADTERNEDFGNHVTGSYDLESFGGSMELGYVLSIFRNGFLRPTAGVHYMNLNFKDYMEKGKGAVRLDDYRTYALQAVLGCTFTSEISFFKKTPGMLDVKVGWRRSLHTSTTDVRATLVDYPNASFDIRGDKYDPDGATGGLGLRFALTKRTIFGIAYDFDYIPAGRYDTDTIRHTFNTLLRFSW